MSKDGGCPQNGFDEGQNASSTSKSFPKISRKRETTGPSAPKYDQNRKSQSQKGRIFDKRPRCRGQYLACGKEDTKVDEESPELGSILGNGSKKVNLNHLLNFHYTPKDRANYKHGRSSLALRGSTRWMQNSQPHKYNKEQFLQANCQFVVKASGDYTRYLNDPDILVDWDQVEQIRVQSSELLSCPICLSQPTAARMTRCGHVFCWPCMLHYLALADKTWRKCPICYEAVHRDDLKSVVALQHAELSVGDIVNMRLMKREKGTLVVVPVELKENPTTLNLSVPVALEDTSMCSMYCKLLAATTSQVVDILHQEEAELQLRYNEEVGSPEICFTEQALELLKQRQAGLSAMTQTKPLFVEDKHEEQPQAMPVTSDQPSFVYKSAFDNIEEKACCISRDRYESVSSEGHESVDSMTSQSHQELENVKAEDLETPNLLQQATLDSKSAKYFYFYQAADGQHLYLHALNARMLEAAYGSLELSPPGLKARIVEKESGSMTAELRNRLRYLQHLPVTCQFEVVELDLRPPLVSRETIHHFQVQLEQRRRQRQRRAKEERRREKKILEEENKRLGLYPTPRLKIESRYQFPECGYENSPPRIRNGEALLSAISLAYETNSPQHVERGIFPRNIINISEIEITSHRRRSRHARSNSVQLFQPTVPRQQNEESLTSCLPGRRQARALNREAVRPESTDPMPSLTEVYQDLSIEAQVSSGPSFAQMLREGKMQSPQCRQPTPQISLTHSDGEPVSGDYVPAPSFNQSFGDAFALALEQATVSHSANKITAEQDTSNIRKKKKNKQKLIFSTSMACNSK